MFCLAPVDIGFALAFLVSLAEHCLRVRYYIDGEARIGLPIEVFHLDGLQEMKPIEQSEVGKLDVYREVFRCECWPCVMRLSFRSKSADVSVLPWT